MIAVPIRASLAPIAAEIEKQVETRFADTTRERGIDIRYEVARDPLKLTMIGAGLHATTTVKYALEACRGRFPCISCGFGEPRRVALEGTPRFDPATSAVVVPDLDYSLETRRRGILARIAERAAHESIRQRLREAARFELRSRIAEVRAEVTRALNRKLAEGVTLRGRADAIEPESVTPLREVISVRVVVTGAVEVELR